MREETGPRASRNPLQTVTLLDAIAEHRFDAVFGGARRDEERARAKERVYSHRDEFGQWDPKNQRPELWDLYNARHQRGEHLRIFPLSNWTELDIWRFIDERKIDLPDLYFAHEREVFQRDGMLMAVNPWLPLIDGEDRFVETVRFRTIGDATCTAAVDIDGAHGRRRRRRDLGGPGHRARRHPCRRQDLRSRHGRPQAARATSDGHARSPRCASPPSGSVDDGKSTLIGRLLHDSKSIFEDQLEHIDAVSKRRGNDYVDLALLTDGLRAEREQGITIDVAYRYFSTPHRDFVIADCPGHIQYTRNMITGASTADLAIVLSTPATASSSRPAGTACSCRCSECHTS